MNRPTRLAVLISGTGTTLQNFLDCIEDGRLDARVVLVVSNNPEAFGLVRAARAGLPRLVVTRKETGGNPAFSGRIFAACREAGADLVCLSGFLQLLEVPDDFRNRVMNIHPSILPSFSGKGFFGRVVHEAVLAHGVKLTGCTVHFADNEYDRGPIILQRAVPVRDDDTPETLSARVYEAECEAYPEAVRLFGEGKLRVEGRRVRTG